MCFAVVNPPVIMIEPESMLDVRSGSNVTLSVEAVGLHLLFSWQRNDGKSLTSDPRVSGASTNRLTIQGVVVEDSGEYVCEVSNAAGTVRSKRAIISVSKYPETVTFYWTLTA